MSHNTYIDIPTRCYSTSGHFILNNKPPTRIVNIGTLRFSGENVGLLLSLLAGSALGVTIAGSSTGFEAAFLDFLTISSLIIVPICAKRSGYRLALGIGIIAIPTSIATLLSRSAYPLISPEQITLILWGVTQIAVVKLAYTAHKHAQYSNLVMQADRNAYLVRSEHSDETGVGREVDIQAASLSSDREHERELLVH